MVYYEIIYDIIITEFKGYKNLNFLGRLGSGRKRDVMVCLPYFLSCLFKFVKLCCIDVGTNSVLHLLARIDSKGRITPLQFHAETIRLGKSLRKNGILKKKSQIKTISVVKKYLKGEDKYLIVGTSALREARNSNEFSNFLYKTTGQKIKILSGNQEASLVFNAVKHFMKPLPSKTIICDIGGGSTEFIFCKNGKVLKKTSIPIGAVNLTERFKNNIVNMEYFIRSRLKKDLNIYTGFKLIGVGGTVTTLGAILKNLKYYNPQKVHKYVVPFQKVISTLKRLGSISLSERKKIITFDPKRADIIVAGICILKVIMESFVVDKFRICDRGLVYGLAVDYLK